MGAHHPPLVSIRNLTLEASTSRGTAHILRGIDLDIGRGRIVGVVGESGSGKSSLASCLLRLLPANVTRIDGQIVFDGTDLVTLDDAAMNDYRGRRIAMIFQDPMTALNPLFTIGTHLVDVLRRRNPGLRHDEAMARATAALVSVGIGDATLRLAILSAPAVRRNAPAGDDRDGACGRAGPAGRRRMHDGARCDGRSADRRAARRPLRRGFDGSIVFISHHLGLVAQLCDDVCVMYAGTIVETGPVADVLARPRHPYTRALLDCELDDHAHGGRLVSIAGEVPDPVTPHAACVFSPRCLHATDACRASIPALRDAGPAASRRVHQV